LSLEEYRRLRGKHFAHVKAQAKAPLKDAAAVNATRWALFNRLKGIDLPIETGSGGLTKFNGYEYQGQNKNGSGANAKRQKAHAHSTSRP
jgi:hypothetical protein